MSSELFKYDSVEVCYGEKAIVEEISFTLKPGEILGIAGESGSGKSTIIKAALGILGPSGKVTKGDIRFQGKKPAGSDGKGNAEDPGCKNRHDFSGRGIFFLSCPHHW